MSNNRNLWLFGGSSNILKDKNMLIEQYVRYMLARTLTMFEYKGLPETIPAREIELIIQMCRFAIFTKKDDNLFVFYGGLGGQPNEYYQPTQAIVVNPYLKFSETLELTDYIKKDSNAVVIWNDLSHIGLYPMFRKNSELLAECDITLRYQLINKRFMNILTANDDNEKQSIEDMFAKVESGDGFGVLVTKKLFEESSIDKLETRNSSQTSDIKDLIEVQQYIKGSWFNDLGLNANFNMKREAINESESDMNEDSLLPLIDSMLVSRKRGLEELNKLFGTEITVELSSSWKKIRKEIEQREEVLETQIEEQSVEEVTPEVNEDDTTTNE